MKEDLNIAVASLELDIVTSSLNLGVGSVSEVKVEPSNLVDIQSPNHGSKRKHDSNPPTPDVIQCDNVVEMSVEETVIDNGSRIQKVRFFLCLLIFSISVTQLHVALLHSLSLRNYYSSIKGNGYRKSIFFVI